MDLENISMDLENISKAIQKFNEDRDWSQFHNLKDVAAAISIESAELQELFLWQKSENSLEVYEKNKEKIEQEIADIAIFLILFVNKANINLEEAIMNKIKINIEKYPIKKAKGKSDKYTEL